MRAARIAFEFACILGALCAVTLASPFWLGRVVLMWHANKRSLAKPPVLYISPRSIPKGESYVVTRYVE